LSAILFSVNITELFFTKPLFPVSTKFEFLTTLVVLAHRNTQSEKVMLTGTVSETARQLRG
jgi:hypothetical protein